VIRIRKTDLTALKNLLKDLPTYETLFKRKTNLINDDKCKRCKKNQIETWEHVWLCEDNESSIEEIVQESIYNYEKYLETTGNTEDIQIARIYNYDFI